MWNDATSRDLKETYYDLQKLLVGTAGFKICLPDLVPTLLELPECLACLLVGNGIVDIDPFTTGHFSHESTTTAFNVVEDGSDDNTLVLTTCTAVFLLTSLDQRPKVLIPGVMDIGGSSAAQDVMVCKEVDGVNSVGSYGPLIVARLALFHRGRREKVVRENVTLVVLLVPIVVWVV